MLRFPVHHLRACRTLRNFLLLSTCDFVWHGLFPPGFGQLAKEFWFLDLSCFSASLKRLPGSSLRGLLHSARWLLWTVFAPTTMPPKRSATAAKSAKAAGRGRKKTGLQDIEEEKRPPDRHGADGDLSLSTRNKELIQRYTTFLDSLTVHMTKMENDHKAEIARVICEEEEVLRRHCCLYTEKQLAMTVPEFEKSLAEAEAPKPKPVVPEDKPPSAAKENQENVEIVEAHPKVKIPVGPKKRTAPKGKDPKRRPSFVNNAYFTPALNIRLRRPKFMTTGIKDVGVRLARVGEIAYSENGSPMVVMAPNAGANSLELFMKNGELVEDVV